MPVILALCDDHRVTTNDNGSLYVIHNDNQSWTQYIDNYDTLGRNTFEQFNFDNGTCDDITIDNLTQQSLARDVYSNNAANAQTQHYLSWMMARLWFCD
jgi:hypothetical protein